MANIKTYTAGIIAALGVAGAALAGAGTASALTDQPNIIVPNQPGQSIVRPSLKFTPPHVEPNYRIVWAFPHW